MAWLMDKITKLLLKRRKETKAQIQPMTHEDFRMILTHNKEQREQLLRQIEYNAARGWGDPSDWEDIKELYRVHREITWLEPHTYNAPLPENFFTKVADDAD